MTWFRHISPLVGSDFSPSLATFSPAGELANWAGRSLFAKCRHLSPPHFTPQRPLSLERGVVARTMCRSSEVSFQVFGNPSPGGPYVDV